MKQRFIKHELVIARISYTIKNKQQMTKDTEYEFEDLYNAMPNREVRRSMVRSISPNLMIESVSY